MNHLEDMVVRIKYPNQIFNLVSVIMGVKYV